MNNKILEKLIELEEESTKLSAEYEKKESYEMAFIAIWLVLENIMKQIASLEVKKNLRFDINNWIEHLNNPEKVKRPKDIKNFATEYTSSSIPPISLIEAAIGDVPELKKLMDSGGKYRRKRNNIGKR